MNKIYIDVDDCVLHSLEFVVKAIDRSKSINDLVDWGMTSIKPNITQKEVLSHFDSEDFFKSVKVNKGFIEFYKTFKDRIIFCSKGSPINQQRKEKYLKKLFPEAQFIGVGLNESKAQYVEQGSVQIDDVVKNLITSASTKICLQIYKKSFDWQNPIEGENIIFAQSWVDIEKIIKEAT